MQATEIAFPPIPFRSGPQHLMCSTGDPAEFLATASAWLELSQSNVVAMQDDDAWEMASRAHRSALCVTRDITLREALLERLETSLFAWPAYAKYWSHLAELSVSEEMH